MTEKENKQPDNLQKSLAGLSRLNTNNSSNSGQQRNDGGQNNGKDNK